MVVWGQAYGDVSASAVPDPFAAVERDIRGLVAAAWWPAAPPLHRQNLVAGRMLGLPDGTWWLFGAGARWYRWTPGDGQWHLCFPPQGTAARMSARPLRQGMPVPQIPPHLVPAGPDFAYRPIPPMPFVDAGIPPEVTARVRATVESAAALPAADHPHGWPTFSPSVPSTIAATWGVMLWAAAAPVFDSRLDDGLLGLWAPYRARPLPEVDGPRWLTPPPLEALTGLYAERLRAGRVDAAVVILRTMWAMAGALREDTRFRARADALLAVLGATLGNPADDYGTLPYGDGALVQQWVTRCPPALAPALRIEASPGEHFRGAVYDLAAALAPIAGDPAAPDHVEPRQLAAAFLAADLAVVRRDIAGQIIAWLEPEARYTVQTLLGGTGHPLRRLWPEEHRLPRVLRDRIAAIEPSDRGTLLAGMYAADLAWCRLGGGIPARPRGFPMPVAILAEILGAGRATSAAPSEPLTPAPGVAPLGSQYASDPEGSPIVTPAGQQPPTGSPGQAPTWAVPSQPAAVPAPPGPPMPVPPSAPSGPPMANPAASAPHGAPASPSAAQAAAGGEPAGTQATQAWQNAAGDAPVPGSASPAPAAEHGPAAPSAPSAPPATRGWAEAAGEGSPAVGGGDVQGGPVSSAPEVTRAWAEAAGEGFPATGGGGVRDGSASSVPPATRAWAGTTGETPSGETRSADAGHAAGGGPAAVGAEDGSPNTGGTGPAGPGTPATSDPGGASGSVPPATVAWDGSTGEARAATADAAGAAGDAGVAEDTVAWRGPDLGAAAGGAGAGHVAGRPDEGEETIDPGEETSDPGELTMLDPAPPPAVPPSPMAAPPVVPSPMASPAGPPSAGPAPAASPPGAAPVHETHVDALGGTRVDGRGVASSGPATPAPAVPLRLPEARRSPVPPPPPPPPEPYSPAPSAPMPVVPLPAVPAPAVHVPPVPPGPASPEAFASPASPAPHGAPGTRIMPETMLRELLAAPMPGRPAEPASPPAEPAMPEVVERFGIRFVAGPDDVASLLDEVRDVACTALVADPAADAARSPAEADATSGGGAPSEAPDAASGFGAVPGTGAAVSETSAGEGGIGAKAAEEPVRGGATGVPGGPDPGGDDDGPGARDERAPDTDAVRGTRVDLSGAAVRAALGDADRDAGTAARAGAERPGSVPARPVHADPGLGTRADPAHAGSAQDDPAGTGPAAAVRGARAGERVAVLLVGAPHSGQRRLTRLIARTLADAGVGDGSVRTADGAAPHDDPAAMVAAHVGAGGPPLLFERLDTAILRAPDPAAVAAALVQARAAGGAALVATCEPSSYERLAAGFPAATAGFRVFRLPDFGEVAARMALAHVLADERRVTIGGPALPAVRADMARLTGYGDLVGARLVESYLERAVARHTGRAGVPPDRLVLEPGDLAGVAEEMEPALRAPGDVDGFLRILDEMCGLDEVKRTVRELVARARTAGRPAGARPGAGPAGHLVFTGRPGTGRRTVAGLLGGAYAALNVLGSGHVAVCSARDLAGDDAAARVEAQVARAAGGVLLVEDAALLGRSPAAVAALLRWMDERRGTFVLVCSGGPEEMAGFLDAHPAFHAAVDRVVRFEEPTDRELVRLFTRFAERDLYLLDEELRVELLGRFGVLRRSPEFAFADTVRWLFDQVVARQAARLAGAPVSAAEVARLSAGDLPGPEETAPPRGRHADRARG